MQKEGSIIIQCVVYTALFTSLLQAVFKAIAMTFNGVLLSIELKSVLL